MLQTMMRVKIYSPPSRVVHSWRAIKRRQHSVVAALDERGLVKTVTSPNLDRTAASKPIALYCGVDPTAASLHVGNLLTLLPVLHFYIHGHTAVTLVGGATGQVGDPAGKSAEREKMAQQLIARNVVSITGQLEKFFEHGRAYAAKRGHSQFGKVKIVNNADWYGPLTFMQFMNDVGRNVRISSMLARDSVKNRLSGDGMNFGEFTYQLLQAYDFWHLHKHHDVRLQIGGSDQYGNITAGIDLVSRLQGVSETGERPDDAPEVFGLTVPLLTTASGAKFGKSAGNAIWLDPSMTSPFDLYQYFLRTQDKDVSSYLHRFTLLSMQEIDSLMTRHQAEPKRRHAARVLAGEVLELVHGQAALDKVVLACRVLFPADFETDEEPLRAETIMRVFATDAALSTMRRVDVVGAKVVNLMRLTGIVQSNREARQLIQGGGVRCGPNVVTDIEERVSDDFLLDDKVLILRVGKNKFRFIRAE